MDDVLDREGGEASEGMDGSVTLPRIKVYNADVPGTTTVLCVGDAGGLKTDAFTEIAVKGAQRIGPTLREALSISEKIYVCRIRKRTAVEEVVHEVLDDACEHPEQARGAELGIEGEGIFPTGDHRLTFDDCEIKDGDMLGVYNHAAVFRDGEGEGKMLSPKERGMVDLTVPGTVMASLLSNPHLFSY